MSALGTMIAGLMFAARGQTDFGSDLDTLTNLIVNEYFRMFKCVTYITDNPEYWNYVENGKHVFLVKIESVESFEGRILTESYEQGCGGYVIQIDREKRSPMLEILKNAKYDAIGYRYIKQRYLFLPTSANDVDVEFLNHEILFFFPNLLFVIPKRSGFDLVSHTIFHAYKHDVLNMSHDIVDRWSPRGGFEANADLYPNRIKNIWGKNLRFALIHYVPYTLILTSGNKTVYDGLEPRIAATFVDRINGTWDAEDHPVELWGDFLENGTANGILGAVQRHTADFGFAAIYQWNCDSLDCSYSYVQAGITCMVPRPQLVSGWNTILIPFQLSTWIGLTIAYFLISIFVLYLTIAMNRMRGVKSPGFLSMAFDSFFNVFRLQLEQIPKVAYKNSPVATYIRISTLYYYFVAAFWQGIIASVLMAPQYEKPIDTAMDMIENFPRVKWGANHDSWILAISNALDPILRKIIDEYIIMSDEELDKRPPQRDFSYFMERLPHGHYGFNDYINKKNMPYLRIMRKDVYRANVVTVMPRDCPYAEDYDHLLSWMFDTGIIHKLEDQVSLEVIDNEMQLMIRTSNEKERYEGIVLALRHLEGPLYIYALGISISTLTFIAERIYFKSEMKKRPWVQPKVSLFERVLRPKV